jgi:hypothetical protein
MASPNGGRRQAASSSHQTPEFHRLRARLNWARGGESSAVKADFDQALTIARRQEAGLFESRRGVRGASSMVQQLQAAQFVYGRQ